MYMLIFYIVLHILCDYIFIIAIIVAQDFTAVQNWIIKVYFLWFLFHCQFSMLSTSLVKLLRFTCPENRGLNITYRV